MIYMDAGSPFIANDARSFAAQVSKTFDRLVVCTCNGSPFIAMRVCLCG